MAKRPAQDPHAASRLRLVGQEPAAEERETGVDDPAASSLQLIDSMSRRIDVLARELKLDDEHPRPRAA